MRKALSRAVAAMVRAVRALRAGDAPPPNLDDAIGTGSVRDASDLAAIRVRLADAAQNEWATRALDAFDRDPYRFIGLYALARGERLETTGDVLDAFMELYKRTGQRTFRAALRREGLTQAQWEAQFLLRSMALPQGGETPTRSDSEAPRGKSS